MSDVLDLVIIGAGPAGMSAALYAKRAMLDFVILEKGFPGGQVLNTYEVENYPAVGMTSGMELSGLFQSQLAEFDVEVQTADVESIEVVDGIKEIKTAYSGTFKTKTLIVATGASWRKLGAIGEVEFAGRGASYCATCDGAFYRDKEVLVVGGGDTAVEDAIYLARMCKKVTLAHRRDELRAVKVLQEKMFAIENIDVMWFNELEEIYGEQVVQGAKLRNNKTDEYTDLKVDGVFIAVGTDPNSSLLEGVVDLDGSGWVIADEDCHTSVEGIFAAGDLRVKHLRQIITAAADGAIAVFAAEKLV